MSKVRLTRNVGTSNSDDGEVTRECQKPYKLGQVLDTKDLRPAELAWLEQRSLVEPVAE